MEDFQHVGYSKEVIEFVAVAKEFCDFVETAPQMQRRDFIQRLQKFIPLIYLKGSLLPESDSGDSGLIEDIVTEDDYNYLYGQLHRLLGEYDEYLEVFDDNMQFSEVPVVHSIAEKTCDIYQDLKNFISSFRCGIPEVIGEALWQLNNSFELYWGKACAGVLRAVHHAVYQVKDAHDSVFENVDSFKKDHRSERNRSVTSLRVYGRSEGNRRGKAGRGGG